MGAPAATCSFFQGRFFKVQELGEWELLERDRQEDTELGVGGGECVCAPEKRDNHSSAWEI